MPLLKKDDNSWAKSGQENLDILRESHFKNSTTSFYKKLWLEYTMGGMPPKGDW